MEIHSSDQFNYALHIESKSGAAAKTPEHCGFNGTTMYFFKHEIEIEFQPRVTPKFLRCCMQLTNKTKVNYPDSISVVAEQRIFHKNVPELPYSVRFDPNTIAGTPSCHWGNYSMGPWHLKIEKWKDGNYSITHDSIYLDWKDIETYTVEW